MRNTEVDDLDRAAVSCIENVGRLDIAMDDTFVMDWRQSKFGSQIDRRDAYDIPNPRWCPSRCDGLAARGEWVDGLCLTIRLDLLGATP